ncbi:MAG: hypothetical protein ACFB51_07120 [Anaerolineae bacterium]
MIRNLAGRLNTLYAEDLDELRRARALALSAGLLLIGTVLISVPLVIPVPEAFTPQGVLALNVVRSALWILTNIAVLALLFRGLLV